MDDGGGDDDDDDDDDDDRISPWKKLQRADCNRFNNTKPLRSLSLFHIVQRAVGFSKLFFFLLLFDSTFQQAHPPMECCCISF